MLRRGPAKLANRSMPLETSSLPRAVLQRELEGAEDMTGDGKRARSTCYEWSVHFPKPEVTDVDFMPDIPLELLPAIQTGERIWPRVFPGL
jgi:hypothetical protein